MPTNPLYTHFMASLRQYDQLTLVLFGVSLVAVLIGWAMLGRQTPAWQKDLYFGFVALAYGLILAGCAYVIITGAFA